MYGNYQTQQCYTLPTVNSLTPINGAIIDYGTFIEATASFSVYNNEPNTSYTYGWQVIRINGSVDISQDVIKTFYHVGLLDVHFDNNVLQPNQNYNVTFYVSGNNTYYNGF